MRETVGIVLDNNWRGPVLTYAISVIDIYGFGEFSGEYMKASAAMLQGKAELLISMIYALLFTDCVHQA